MLTQTFINISLTHFYADSSRGVCGKENEVHTMEWFISLTNQLRKQLLVKKALMIMGIDPVTDKGDVRNKHLMQILDYLVDIDEGDYDRTLSKLCITMGIDKRRVRENYLEPLEAWEIISIYTIDRKRIWKLMVRTDEEEESKPQTIDEKRVLISNLEETVALKMAEEPDSWSIPMDKLIEKDDRWLKAHEDAIERRERRKQQLKEQKVKEPEKDNDGSKIWFAKPTPVQLAMVKDYECCRECPKSKEKTLDQCILESCENIKVH